mmetsp:Transcript_51752/g.116485  ORF Transcript_51752/g.116485 Transcript_51752/m.116485 type:complete len:212 (+) Transcript_51752:746-1381(+)
MVEVHNGLDPVHQLWATGHAAHIGGGLTVEFRVCDDLLSLLQRFVRDRPRRLEKPLKEDHGLVEEQVHRKFPSLFWILGTHVEEQPGHRGHHQHSYSWRLLPTLHASELLWADPDHYAGAARGGVKQPLSHAVGQRVEDRLHDSLATIGAEHEVEKLRDVQAAITVGVHLLKEPLDGGVAPGLAIEVLEHAPELSPVDAAVAVAVEALKHR